MYSIKSLVAGAAMVLVGSAASAATVTVDFTATSGMDILASGSFSYDDSLTGALDYSDLDSFNVTFATDSYDLAYVTDATRTFRQSYFGWDATLQTFVGQLLGQTDQLFSAFEAGQADGFLIRDDGRVRDFPNGTQRSDNFSVSVSPVPLPAALPLLIAGLGGLGLMRRRRRAA